MMDEGLISKLTGSVRLKLPFVRHFGTNEIRSEVIAVPSEYPLFHLWEPAFSPQSQTVRFG